MSPRRRRHELALLILFLILALLVGYWFGRMSAPDSTVAYEKGRAAGQTRERQRTEQNRIEANILSEEVAATRSRIANSEQETMETTRDSESAKTGANNR